MRRVKSRAGEVTLTLIGLLHVMSPRVNVVGAMRKMQRLIAVVMTKEMMTEDLLHVKKAVGGTWTVEDLQGKTLKEAECHLEMMTGVMMIEEVLEMMRDAAQVEMIMIEEMMIDVGRQEMTMTDEVLGMMMTDEVLEMMTGVVLRTTTGGVLLEMMTGGDFCVMTAGETLIVTGNVMMTLIDDLLGVTMIGVDHLGADKEKN